jgi:hypothetical protein
MAKLNLIKTNKNAFALILALFFLLAFSVLGLTAIRLASLKSDIYINQTNNLKSRLLFAAGRNYFLQSISTPFFKTFYDSSVFPQPASPFNKTLGATNETLSIVCPGWTVDDADCDLTTQVVMPKGNYQLSEAFKVAVDTDVANSVSARLLADFKNWPFYFRTTSGTVHVDNAGQTWLTIGIYAPLFFDVGTTRKVDFRRAYVALNLSTYNPVSPPKNIYSTGNFYFYGTFVRKIINGDLCLGGTCTADASKPNCSDWIYGTVNTPYSGWPNIYSDADGSVMPQINTTYYSKLLTKAQNSTTTSLTISTTINPTLLNLAGRNIYVNGPVTITSTSAQPLTGPGNIIANGNITVSANAHIRDTVGLITAGSIAINSDSVVGGVLDANNFVVGKGVLLYAAAPDTAAFAVNFYPRSRSKVFALVPYGETFIGKSTSSPYDYATVQGLIYTNYFGSGYVGRVYAIIYSQIFRVSSGYTYLRPERLYDVVNFTSGAVSTASELPLRVKNLYDLKITNP